MVKLRTLHLLRPQSVDDVDTDELSKMEAYVASKNDPRIIRKTVQFENGGEVDTIDCVDIVRQHGYDSPITNIAAPPSVKGFNDTPRPVGELTPNVYVPDCPAGTIPRRRLTISELKRAGSLRNFFRKRGAAEHAPGVDDSIHQYAHYVRNGDNVGARATFNHWYPSVSGSDMSLAQIWVTRGSYAAGTVQTVELGWQVYPGKYGSSTARVFAYSTRDAYISTGCYNLDCSDFVQTNPVVTLGGVVGPSSVTGGSQYAVAYTAQMDASYNWWLGWNGVWFGYYPHSLYNNSTGLGLKASAVDFGGEMAQSPNALSLHSGTDMGSGAFAAAGFGAAAYIRNIEYIGGTVSAPVATVASGGFTSVTNSSCYCAIASNSGSWSQTLYFGGPGANTACIYY